MDLRGLRLRMPETKAGLMTRDGIGDNRFVRIKEVKNKKWVFCLLTIPRTRCNSHSGLSSVARTEV